MAVARVRREPPKFRPVKVRAIEHRTPRLYRVTIGGPDLDGFEPPDPAASVRLLLPSPGASEVEIPSWEGNQFLLADGSRPTIRTFTPLRFRPDRNQLDVEIVLHGGGAASAWATTARPGDGLAISGPGRGTQPAPDARRYLLVGDETAVPAIGQLLDVLTGADTIDVHVEMAAPEAQLPLGDNRAAVRWHLLGPDERPGDRLVDAVTNTDIDDTTAVWAAGEAAGVQRIRRLLFTERGLPRTRATIRGYWKHGRSGGDDDG